MSGGASGARMAVIFAGRSEARCHLPFASRTWSPSHRLDDEPPARASWRPSGGLLMPGIGAVGAFERVSELSQRRACGDVSGVSLPSGDSSAETIMPRILPGARPWFRLPTALVRPRRRNLGLPGGAAPSKFQPHDAVARLRWSVSRREWTLDWCERNHHWHPSEYSRPTTEIADLLRGDRPRSHRNLLGLRSPASASSTQIRWPSPSRKRLPPGWQLMRRLPRRPLAT